MNVRYRRLACVMDNKTVTSKAIKGRWEYTSICFIDLALIWILDPFTSHPFPESKCSVLNPNPQQILILFDNLQALQCISLSLFIHSLHFLPQCLKSFVLLLQLAFLPYLDQLFYLCHQLLIYLHVSIQVLSHDLILEKVKFAELEGQELSKKVLHMLLVLAREKPHEVA